MSKKICVIGGGRWGQNHIRTLSQMDNLGGIVESNSSRLNELLELYHVKGFEDINEALQMGFDGYIVAVPAPFHYTIGKKILEKGQNVLIEKPLTLNSHEAAELVSIADSTCANLMVGHVMLFHPAIRKIKDILDSGKIGKLFYIYSNRLNFGTVRTEENVFWSLAPHDISILDYFIGEKPISINAKGERFLQSNVYDSTIAHFEYPGNIHAHIYTSWLHPFKEHRLVIIGSKGMLSFEDSSKDKDIVYYHKHIKFDDGFPIKIEEPDEVIEYEKKMPLNEELTYFVRHLDKKIEIVDGRAGYEVVKILEKVQELIDSK